MITLEQVLKAYEYANSHPHKYLRGTTNWCAAVAHILNEQNPARPVPECLSDLERFEADDGEFVRLGDVIDMLANKPAAQHQDSPLSELNILRAAVKDFEAIRDARVDAKLAGSQGEPVAFRYRFDADKGSMVASEDGEWIPYSRRNAGIAATVSDHPQCEECKGWGYHENHHEGGGTECGECGGSGKATVAVVMVMPDRMEVEPFTTIDRGSKNYKAGYNAALAEVARLNRVNQ